MNNEIAVKVIDAIESVLIGKRRTAHMAVTAFLAGGHVLLEDVPGVGKTTLGLALATAVGCEFGRIQFTPDTMPTDITGVSVFNQKLGEFVFQKGAIMKSIILADEINRTPPKTQAALLEAMDERQITVDGTTYKLPEPFFVIATQNPIEQQGTYNLPEAQVDRFMMRLSIGYPTIEDEAQMVTRYATGAGRRTVEPVTDVATVLKMQQEVLTVQLDEKLCDYIAQIVAKSRDFENIALGASPRAAIAIARASQAVAYIDGRDYVRPDDIKLVTPSIMAHRIKLSHTARATRISGEAIINNLLASVTVPV